MKIGTQIFYNLEHSRQDYLKALEAHPWISGLLGFGIFLVYAVKTPVHQKLYKEVVKSAMLGFTASYGVTYYYYSKYIEVVNESYEAVKKKFDEIPGFAESIDGQDDNSHHVIKNFGLSAWNDSETEDDFDMDDNQAKFFEGTADEERQERRQYIVNKIYGE